MNRATAAVVLIGIICYLVGYFGGRADMRSSIKRKIANGRWDF